MTSLPQPLPVDLEEIKALITERTDAIAAQDAIIDNAQEEKFKIKEEVTLLQEQAKKLLSITPPPDTKLPDRDPITGQKLETKTE